MESTTAGSCDRQENKTHTHTRGAKAQHEHCINSSTVESARPVHIALAACPPTSIGALLAESRLTSSEAYPTVCDACGRKLAS